MNRESIDRLARILWDYHRMNHRLEKADLIFVLGSHDIRVADYAARLFNEGLAPCILLSGGSAHQGDLLHTGWDKSEAEVFADRALQLGVPSSAILLEKEARNTGENVQFAQRILKERGLSYNKVLAVQKPYMERRTYATIKVHWPRVKLIVTSPPLTFDQYPNGEISYEELINIMTGDLQRIIEYPRKGYQLQQDVPEEVLNAYNELVARGFDRHLIKS